MQETSYIKKKVIKSHIFVEVYWFINYQYFNDFHLSTIFQIISFQVKTFYTCLKYIPLFEQAWIPTKFSVLDLVEIEVVLRKILHFVNILVFFYYFSLYDLCLIWLKFVNETWELVANVTSIRRQRPRRQRRHS